MHILERAETYGAESLSDSDLLHLIVGSAAQTLLNEAGSISDLRRWGLARIARVAGVGPQLAGRIVAALAISYRTQGTQPQILNTPELIYAFFQADAVSLEVEKFWVLCLNRKNALIKRVEVTSGTATASLVHPREVFRQAIIAGAVSIVVVHNHPSGDPSPSSADIQVTRQLREAARTVGIDILDHLIVGQPARDPRAQGFYSFHEAGLI